MCGPASEADEMSFSILCRSRTGTCRRDRRVAHRPEPPTPAADRPTTRWVLPAWWGWEVITDSKNFRGWAQWSGQHRGNTRATPRSRHSSSATSVRAPQSLSARLMLALEHRALNRIQGHRQMTKSCKSVSRSNPSATSIFS